MRRVARAQLLCAALLCVGAKASAQTPACSDPAVPFVVLRKGAAGTQLSLTEISRHLAAGFAASNVAVCTDAAAGPKRIAEVELESASDSSTATEQMLLRIRMQDAVTNKTLERSVDLIAVPADSRSVLVALYIEELLQASWIETSLKDRIYLQEHPVVTPPEVQREIETVLPSSEPSTRRAGPGSMPTNASERRFVLSFQAALLHLHNGLTQVGPELSFAWIVWPWLELGARAGYRLGPTVSAPHGSIDVQSLLMGVFIAPRWQSKVRVSLHFPQSVDVPRVRFKGHADASVEAATAVRYGVLISHGAGIRVALTALLSLGALGRFCWTLLPAEAADSGHAVTGISGLGGEGTLSLNLHF